MENLNHIQNGASRILARTQSTERWSLYRKVQDHCSRMREGRDGKSRRSQLTMDGPSNKQVMVRHSAVSEPYACTTLVTSLQQRVLFCLQDGNSDKH